MDISFGKILNSKSTKARMGISLFANIFRAGTNFIATLILARMLDSTGYGDLMFMLGSFNAIRSLTDMGAGNAFFTFISQGTNRSSHYWIYFTWLLLQVLLLSLIIGIVFPASWLEIIWLGKSKTIILLALFAFFFQQQGWQTLNQIGESERNTVWTQVFGIIIAMINLLGILLLVIFEKLTLDSVLIFYIIEYIGMSIWVFIALDVKQYFIYNTIEKKSIQKILRQYMRYCYPLLAITLISFLYNYIDTWMLQYFGGSSQQGLFQIANQITMISLLVTSSILNIFWKEIATAYEEENVKKIQNIYHKVMRGLIMCGAIISGFLVPWTNQIAHVLLGNDYNEVAPILMIMFYYPIHQSMGQLNAAFLMATNQTMIYSISSILIMMASMPISYFFQAPSSGYLVPGLGLGACGAALKTVILNFVSVNIGAYIIARIQRWKYDYRHQFYAIFMTGIMGYIAYYIASVCSMFFFEENLAVIFHGLMAVLIYSIGIAHLVYYIPSLAGLSEVERDSIIQRIKKLRVF